MYQTYKFFEFEYFKHQEICTARIKFDSGLHLVSEEIELGIKQRCRPIIKPPNTVLEEVFLGKIENIRDHPNFKMQLQTNTKSFTIVQLTFDLLFHLFTDKQNFRNPYQDLVITS